MILLGYDPSSFLVSTTFTFPSLVMGFYFSTQIIIYRPITSMLVLSWLIKNSVTTVNSIAIVLILKNLNWEQRNIHILKCNFQKCFWNLKHYEQSHKRFEHCYFVSREGLYMDHLEVLLQSLCSVLEVTSRNHRPQNENPSSVTIAQSHKMFKV